MTAPGIASDSFVHRIVAGVPVPVGDEIFSLEHARRISAKKHQSLRTAYCCQSYIESFCGLPIILKIVEQGFLNTDLLSASSVSINNKNYIPSVPAILTFDAIRTNVVIY